MADSKISALPASTVPLAGTEVLPIVQSSTTKQVSVANLTAGRAISATQITLTTGSVIVASGQGIDFSATPGTGTSELLADYEEGTWTPIDGSGASLVFSVLDARYTKIGRMVECYAQITYPSTISTSQAIIGGLPFTLAGTAGAAYGAFTVYTDYSVATTWLSINSSTTSKAYALGGGAVTNATVSTKNFRLVWIYEV
jgi:hypothetical protein